MNQLKNKPHLADIHEDQFQYMGRWVDKSTFRAMVFDRNGTSQLAPSYAEYESMIASGLWFDTVEKAKEREKRAKDNAILKPNS